MRCAYMTSSTSCIRCFSCKAECTFTGPPAQPKHEHLFNLLREQETKIKDLTAQLEMTSTRVPYLTSHVSTQDTFTQPPSPGSLPPSSGPLFEPTSLPAKWKASKPPLDDILEGFMGDEPQGHPAIASVPEETTNTTWKPACSRCKSLKTKCVFKLSSRAACERCLKGGYDCVASKPKQRQIAP